MHIHDHLSIDRSTLIGVQDGSQRGCVFEKQSPAISTRHFIGKFESAAMESLILVVAVDYIKNTQRQFRQWPCCDLGKLRKN